jgi:ribosomal-protein-alanine N-acetyltransferase
MDCILETERLCLREIKDSDELGLFELDSNPEVHRFLGNSPVTEMSQIRTVIAMLRKQYVENGIARWAVLEKETNKFIGWCGLKFYTDELNNHSRFYELGYRFIESEWGKGYATESSRAILQHAFTTMKLENIYAITDAGNDNSRKVLEKCGFNYVTTFDMEGDPTLWFELTKNTWLAKKV